MNLSSDISELIDLAKREDLGAGDVTTSLLDFASANAEFDLVARQPCIFCGVEIAERVTKAYDAAIHIEWRPEIKDGAEIRQEIGAQQANGKVTSDHDPPQRRDPSAYAMARLTGPLGSILAAERVLLNFLQRLCAVATHTRRFVDAIAGTGADVFDTRKTIPGWRELDKLAVRSGGGVNHRAGLYDAILIKDNHLAGVAASRAAGFVFDLLNRLPVEFRPAFVAVEATSLAMVDALLRVVGVNIILLDNFSLTDVRSAVRIREELGLCDRVQLEVSGGITLLTIRAFADCGVERISVGAVTHSAPAVDLALERV